MVAPRDSYYSPVEDGTDSCIAGIECIDAVYFQHYYGMIPNCHLCIVGSQSAHQG